MDIDPPSGSHSNLLYGEQRRRSTYGRPSSPQLERRESSASSVRSIIDDYMRMADQERGRSRFGSPAVPPSPFRSGSPFEQEYDSSRRGSTSQDIPLSITPPFPRNLLSIPPEDEAQSDVNLPSSVSLPFPKATGGFCRACQIKAREVCSSSLPGHTAPLIRQSGRGLWSQLPALL